MVIVNFVIGWPYKLCLSYISQKTSHIQMIFGVLPAHMIITVYCPIYLLFNLLNVKLKHQDNVPVTFHLTIFFQRVNPNVLVRGLKRGYFFIF